MPTNPANSVPGWEGSVGPFEDQYGKLHVYARDVQSGAGNCVCGASLDHRRHVQAAPGVEIPSRVPPEPEYHRAWTELQGYVREALTAEDQIDPGALLEYMKELQVKALAPINDWIGRKTSPPPPKRMKYVVAGNYMQFEYWCRENEINRHDQSSVRYCATEYHLRGFAGHFDIHIVGTFNDRRDAPQMRGMIEHIKATREDVQVYWE